MNEAPPYVAQLLHLDLFKGFTGADAKPGHHGEPRPGYLAGSARHGPGFARRNGIRSAEVGPSPTFAGLAPSLPRLGVQ